MLVARGVLWEVFVLTERVGYIILCTAHIFLLSSMCSQLCMGIKRHMGAFPGELTQRAQFVLRGMYLNTVGTKLAPCF